MQCGFQDSASLQTIKRWFSLGESMRVPRVGIGQAPSQTGMHHGSEDDVFHDSVPFCFVGEGGGMACFPPYCMLSTYMLCRLCVWIED